MNIPKVSVIMAVKNGEKSLKKTIDSILNQTFKDFEFIIIDDYSDDSTPEILNDYVKQDSRVKVFRNKKWLGRCSSRNKALKEARGEYIAVTDADDISFPARLANEVVYLDTHPKVYLVGSRAEIVDEEDKKIGESWGLGRNGDITELLEKQNRLVHSSVMFRNTHKYKYRRKFIYAQDYDLFLQMVLDKKEIDLLEDVLVKYSTKRDLVYNDYLILQTYYAEIAKYVFREKKDHYRDAYRVFDEKHLEKYVPRKVVLEMKMKKNFFNGKYIQARKYAKKLIDIDPAREWRLYYLDTFLGGNIFRWGKWLKRKFI